MRTFASFPLSMLRALLFQLLLTASLVVVQAWVVSQSPPASFSLQNPAAGLSTLPNHHHLLPLYSTNPNNGNSNDDNDDGGFMDDCEDEEECEIDWSAMPTNSIAEAPPSADTLRRRLEMNWRFQEDAADCDIYEPVTCGSNPCMSCRGAGQAPCRFCGGTRRLQLTHPPGPEVAVEATLFSRSAETAISVACNVCSGQGHEVCRDCAGTGWIADFADMGVRVGEAGSPPETSSAMQ